MADFLGVLRGCFAIDMGMTEDEFVANTVTYIGDVEVIARLVSCRRAGEIAFLFTAHLGVEDDMEQHVA